MGMQVLIMQGSAFSDNMVGSKTDGGFQARGAHRVVVAERKKEQRKEKNKG